MRRRLRRPKCKGMDRQSRRRSRQPHRYARRMLLPCICIDSRRSRVWHFFRSSPSGKCRRVGQRLLRGKHSGEDPAVKVPERGAALKSYAGLPCGNSTPEQSPPSMGILAAICEMHANNRARRIEANQMFEGGPRFPLGDVFLPGNGEWGPEGLP